MALGQVAGVAAHPAIKQQCDPRNIPIHELQQQLASQGQILKHQPEINHASTREPQS